jgi:predicted kinase
MTALPPIEIPVPSLVVLIGAAGAGKSTLAARLFDPGEILSSDDLRAAVAGDAADQRATRTAFSVLHREIPRRLAARRLVVVDATNVERSARAALRGRAWAAGAPTIAIAVLTDPAEIRRRNAGRDRIVPPEIVDRHLRRMALLGSDPAAVVATLLAEGFSAAHAVASADGASPPTIVRISRP